MSTAIYSLPQDLQLYIVVLGPLLTTYFGIYVMISNHYIFKPKIQEYLFGSGSQSIVLQQIMIDGLSSFSVLAFLFNELFLLQSDAGLSVVIYQDLFWCGMCSLLALRAVTNPANSADPSHIMIIKNAIFLCLCYATLAVHYIVGLYLISLGLILMVLYFANFFINANEGRFTDFINSVMQFKTAVDDGKHFRMQNQFESPEFLAKYFPVSRKELDIEMDNYSSKLSRIKLVTKVSATSKLLRICLCIRLSRQKLEQKYCKDVQVHYAILSGTLEEKGRKTEYFPKSKDYEEELEGGQMTTKSSQPEHAILFYLFPVKIFESSRVLSIVYSIFINLAFGVILSLSLQATQTLQYGDFLQFLYAILLLPLLPNISKVEYFNSMAQSSVCKYFLAGLCLTISCAYQTSLSLTWLVNPLIGYAASLQTAVCVVMLVIILSASTYEYKLLFVAAVATLLDAGFIYKGLL